MGDDSLRAGNRKFILDLPALVQGIENGRRGFVEQAVVSTINADEAVLHLKTSIPPGSKVRLSLRVPRTLLLETPLDLDLTGTVADSGRRKKAGRRNRSTVRVRLDRVFRISPAAV